MPCRTNVPRRFLYNHNSNCTIWNPHTAKEEKIWALFDHSYSLEIPLLKKPNVWGYNKYIFIHNELLLAKGSETVTGVIRRNRM